jgi:hypothetical protein
MKLISGLYGRHKPSHFLLAALFVVFLVFADIPRVEEGATS